MKDFQRTKVYKWEQEEFGWDKEEMTLIECQLLVNKVIKEVVVTDGRGRRRGAADVFFGKIMLPKYARRKWYVLHECAHFLGQDKHGPKFVGKYIHLLSTYYKKPIKQLKMSLEDRNIKYI